jgi:hypothetical protein
MASSVKMNFSYDPSTDTYQCPGKQELHPIFRSTAEARLALRPHIMKRRSETIEHVFGTIKQGMNQGAFLMRRLENVSGEFNLTAIAYNIRRAITIVGVAGLLDVSLH